MGNFIKYIKNTALFTLVCTILNIGVFGLEIAGEPVYDSEGTTLSFIYQGHESNSYETMVIYDVTDDDDINTLENSRIIDIRQKRANGRFNYDISSDFNGSYIFKIGGTNQNDIILLLIEAENGQVISIQANVEAGGGDPETPTDPTEPTDPTDPDPTDPNPTDTFSTYGELWILGKDEVMTFDKNMKIVNSVIDSSRGAVVIGTTDIIGRMSFNEEGQIEAVIERTVILKAPAETAGKNNYGFITKKNTKDLAAENGKLKYEFEFRLNGTDGERKYVNDSVFKTVEFDDIYSGTVSMGLVIKNVPDSVTITAN